MENGCKLVLRDSRKILILVDRFKKNNEQKIRDNNCEIETRLRLETLLKYYATCSQPCDAS